jgi:hypothetical protein
LIFGCERRQRFFFVVSTRHGRGEHGLSVSRNPDRLSQNLTQRLIRLAES